MPDRRPDRHPYRHLVLFRVHDHVDDAALAHAVRTLEALGDAPGVVEWTVRLSDDDRKGRVVVENALFADRDAFEAFRASPAHADAGALMRGVADWTVGDYEEPPA